MWKETRREIETSTSFKWKQSNCINSHRNWNSLFNLFHMLAKPHLDWNIALCLALPTFSHTLLHIRRKRFFFSSFFFFVVRTFSKKTRSRSNKWEKVSFRHLCWTSAGELQRLVMWKSAQEVLKWLNELVANSHMLLINQLACRLL